MNRMTTDYKQLFNNKVEEETNRQQLNNQRIDAAKADLVELHNVLVDVLEDSDVLVEEHEGQTIVAHNNRELTVKLDTDEVVDVVVSERAISFEDDVESGDVVAHTDDEDDVRFVVDVADAYDDSEVAESTIVYDKGAQFYSKENLIGYVVERVAEMVAKG